MLLIRLIGSYLDDQKIHTREFFQNFDLYDDSLLPKFNFIKKVQVVFGLTEQHAEILHNKCKTQDDKVLIKKFIDHIE